MFSRRFTSAGVVPAKGLTCSCAPAPGVAMRSRPPGVGVPAAGAVEGSAPVAGGGGLSEGWVVAAGAALSLPFPPHAARRALRETVAPTPTLAWRNLLRVSRGPESGPL